MGHPRCGSLSVDGLVQSGYGTEGLLHRLGAIYQECTVSDIYCVYCPHFDLITGS